MTFGLFTGQSLLFVMSLLLDNANILNNRFDNYQSVNIYDFKSTNSFSRSQFMDFIKELFFNFPAIYMMFHGVANFFTF